MLSLNPLSSETGAAAVKEKESKSISFLHMQLASQGGDFEQDLCSTAVPSEVNTVRTNWSS